MNEEQKVLEKIIDDLKIINYSIEYNQKNFDYVLAHALIEEALTHLNERHNEIKENNTQKEIK